MTQAQIPCAPEDRDTFKVIAAAEKVSMKDLFHKWVSDYTPAVNNGKNQ